jgi:3-oxoacyl-[acyl-carrier protein] reductase
MEAGALAGKVAIVTGGVRRIGRELASMLAAEGAAVAVNARTSAAEADAVVAEIAARGGRAMRVLADVTDEADVARMTQAVLDAWGRIDILVNNAAIRRECAFEEMSLAEWREIMAVVLDGAFLCSRAVLPAMVGQGGGRIVNIGGVSAHAGAHRRAHVSAAKAGLVGLTRALAVEFAARGVTVNCVAPGKIGGKRSATSGRGVAGEPLVGREGTFAEVANAVRMLVVPAGGFVTGQTIHVSGGLYLP